MNGERTFPLAGADGTRLRGLTLVLSGVRQLRKSGWKEFSLMLRDRDGAEGTCPAVCGIYSSAATPLGRLLVLAGFPCVKDWYLSEGGMKGPRKLWAEKGPDDERDRTLRDRTQRELLSFLAGEDAGDDQGILVAARARAEEISRILRPPLVYRGDARSKVQ